MTSALPRFLTVMHQDHVNFLHLLAAFEHQVGAAETGHRPSYHVLKGVLHYFEEYPRQIHHPREEMLIELMKDKASDQATRMKGIIHGHRSLPGRIEELTKALEVFAATSLHEHPPFVALARKFIADEKQHIHDEDHFLFPAAVACLSADDWAWLNSGLGEATDPLFGETVIEHFAQLRKSIYATDKTYRVSS